MQGAPNGERWENYTVLADSQAFGTHAGEVAAAGEQPAAVCCA